MTMFELFSTANALITIGLILLLSARLKRLLKGYRP